MKVNMNYQNFHYLMRVLIIYLDAARSRINAMPELIFMGEYSKLKRMGFTFQKLYASNRMHWIKNNLIICKKHRTFRYCDLPMDVLIHLVLLIQGEKTFDSLCKTVENVIFGGEHKFIEVIVNNNTGVISTDHQKYRAWKKLSYTAFSNDDASFDHGEFSTYSVDKQRFDEIKKFVDLRWLVVVHI